MANQLIKGGVSAPAQLMLAGYLILFVILLLPSTKLVEVNEDGTERELEGYHAKRRIYMLLLMLIPATMGVLYVNCLLKGRTHGGDICMILSYIHGFMFFAIMVLLLILILIEKKK